jgi:Fe2+ transport system protein FeoA
MQKLYKRLRVRLRRRFAGRGNQHRQEQPCDDLNCVGSGEAAIITGNNDHRTMERGLCAGVQIMVMRNEPGEPNLVVAVGDARYVLDRRIAHKIKVKAG